MSQRIRIKLKSYDHNLVDKSAEKIVKTVKNTGAVVSGPVPLLRVGCACAWLVGRARARACARTRDRALAVMIHVR